MQAGTRCHSSRLPARRQCPTHRNSPRFFVRGSILFRSRSTDAWIDLLVTAKIPVGPINDIPAILSDPQIEARDMVQEIEHETAGMVKMLGQVAKFSRTPSTIRHAPPVLGADTEAVLCGRLGYTPETVAAWREEGNI